jgi:hypothetical protein
MTAVPVHRSRLLLVLVALLLAVASTPPVLAVASTVPPAREAGVPGARPGAPRSSRSPGSPTGRSTCRCVHRPSAAGR